MGRVGISLLVPLGREWGVVGGVLGHPLPPSPPSAL